MSRILGSDRSSILHGEVSHARVLTMAVQTFLTERERWKLWIPVLFGAGAAAYLGLLAEPWSFSGLVLLISGVVILFIFRRQQVLTLTILAVVAFAAGFSAMQLRTSLQAAPVIDRKIGPVDLTGRVLRAEPKGNGVRLWLDQLEIGRLSVEKTPEKIRLKANISADHPLAGDRIRVRAILHPPAGPAAPGAFDFARKAWFQQLGGVGYAIRAPETIGRGEGSNSVSLWIARIRQSLTEKIMAALPGPAGAIAAALLTGERGAIPEDILVAMREAGLAHLLAISGLHIGLVGGLLFFAVRFLLVLIEPVALRYPIKKWAAAAALIGSFIYLLLSGATLPTQRAFLMLSLMLTAVMIDRQPISMNLVAFAAMAILLFAPESIADVSFQMSFAAVAGLVAIYEWGRDHKFLQFGGQSVLFKSVRYLAAVCVTTIVASAATAPFALYHFNQIALYSVLANLLAVPLTALWIMPAGVLSIGLAPFGLEGVALQPMGWGIEWLAAVAAWVASLPGAIAHAPAVPPAALAVTAIGGLWLCLWRQKWRIFGVVPLFAGMAIGIVTAIPPDILVSETGKQMAVRDTDGKLVFLRPAKGFVADTWRRQGGEGIQGKAISWRDKDVGANIGCDALGCIYRTGSHNVAFIFDEAALSEDCRGATIVISQAPARKSRCKGPQTIIDRFDVWRLGPHAIRLRDGTAEITTVAETSGQRPWSRYPRKFRSRRR